MPIDEKEIFPQTALEQSNGMRSSLPNSRRSGMLYERDNEWNAAFHEKRVIISDSTTKRILLSESNIPQTIVLNESNGMPPSENTRGRREIWSFKTN